MSEFFKNRAFIAVLIIAAVAAGIYVYYTYRFSFVQSVASTVLVYVQSPSAGATVSSPVNFQASAVSAYPITGYVVYANGVNVYQTSASMLNGSVSLAPGTYSVYIRAWDSTGAYGTSPTFTITVQSSIPPNATTSSNLDDNTKWLWEHDPGTPGSSSGSSAIVATPSRDGTAKQFYATYSNYGGERFHLNFGNDANATHFVYDTWVYMSYPPNFQNLELDMNQVISNGQTVIYGTQCASGSGKWEYTINSSGNAKWLPSNIPCNPRNWSANTWHHIQIASHRDSSGYVTYDWVNVDGTQTQFSGASGNSAFSLGWPVGAMLINFQVDGYGSSGSMNAYADNLTVWRW